MAGSAGNGRLLLLVAIDAPLHLHWLSKLDHFLQQYVSVATPALDLCGGVLAVVKENKLGQSVQGL